MGTSFSPLYADALEQTTVPAAARSLSMSIATLDGRAENTSGTLTNSRVEGTIFNSLALPGIGSDKSQ
jgi:hypothetical protein